MSQNTTQNMREAAVRIINTDGMIENVSKRRWRVASESSPGSWHNVRITNKRIMCDCEYHIKRNGSPCKHTTAIDMCRMPGR